MLSRDVLHSEAPRCFGEPLREIVTLMAVHILEARRDFVARTPFSQERFDDDTLFVF
jgi:hypothetical protein